MQKKGLVISWYFPPINSSEGLCTFKLLKNSKHKYDVFTQKNNKSWSYDTNETQLVSNNINTIFSENSDISEWVKEGIEYFNNNKEKYNYIMSRSMAPESHEIALKIKETNPNILWIASFGDPIANNPYNELNNTKSPYRVKGTGILSQSIRYIFSPKRIIKNIIWEFRDRRYKKNYTRIYKDVKLEKLIINKCDIIILNNKYQQEYMLSKFPEEIQKKALLLPHGYDVDFYKKKEEIKKEKYVISYLGHLDAIRNSTAFLSAILRLKKNRKDLYDKVEFNIYGNMPNNDKIYMVDNDICDVVRFKEPVKYLDSLNIMKNSDLLLLIDANLGTVLPKNIFYPAKLADYIGSGSKIFGITMTDGPSADIIKEVGGVISSHSPDEIYNTLVMILENKIDIKNIDNNNVFNMKTIAESFDKRLNKELSK